MPTKKKAIPQKSIRKATNSVKKPALKAAYSFSVKRFSTVIFTFLMLGVLVGGYFLIKSNATSDCSASNSVDGFNACVSMYYVPNLAPGGDCTVPIADSSQGIWPTLEDSRKFMQTKFGKNIFINEPGYNYRGSTSSRPDGDVRAEPYYSEMGCTGGTSQGMLVFQIENTGSAAWDISKVVGDPAGVHLQVPNPGTLDFGQKFSSSDVIAPGAFLLQRYAYRGATPDPTKYGTNLGSYNVDCPNNTCLQPGQLIDPGDKVWTAKVLSHGDQFTTNKDYAIDFQMLNNYNKFFGNKVTLTVTARSGGIFPSILNSYTNQCMESNESQFGVPVYPSIKDKPICNIATTSNTPATPRITPNPANPWNSK